MDDQNAVHQTGDVDISSPDMVFDNLTILKEFSNIVDSVKTEDFLETVPKAKLSTNRRVKWVPTFNCLKQGILDEMVQEMNAMWKNENMPQRIEALEKQKEKFAEINVDQTLWRPQLDDVKAQLRASDIASLQKQKTLLESLAKEYENRVDRLKKNLTAKRGYLKVLQMDIQKYQKRNDDFLANVTEKLQNHKNLTEVIPYGIDMETNKWWDTKVYINE